MELRLFICNTSVFATAVMYVKVEVAAIVCVIRGVIGCTLDLVHVVCVIIAMYPDVCSCNQ